uniref:J domain-containing protein n=1 Tax=Paramormyrops kingsleyae TaxID=1676925 RepID=A0A3B3SW67_9TELE
ILAARLHAGKMEKRWILQDDHDDLVRVWLATGTHIRNKKTSTPDILLHESETVHESICYVSPSVTQRQIKTSYYRQMLVYHPDRRGRKSEAKQHSLEIREAYIIRGNRILHRRGFSSPATDRQKSSPSSRMPRTSSKDGKLRRIFKIVCTLYCNFTKWDIVQRAKIFLQGSETICDAVLRGYGRFVWLTSQTLGRVILSGV